MSDVLGKAKPEISVFVAHDEYKIFMQNLKYKDTLQRFLPHGGLYNQRPNTHLILKLTPAENAKIASLDALMYGKWQLERIKPGG